MERHTSTVLSLLYSTVLVCLPVHVYSWQIPGVFHGPGNVNLQHTTNMPFLVGPWTWTRTEPVYVQGTSRPAYSDPWLKNESTNSTKKLDKDNLEIRVKDSTETSTDSK